MNLQDLYHYIGGDLESTSTGDLLTSEGTIRGQQRVLRRLLTNPGDYIFHTDYGAGLPRRVGDVVDVPKITALIRGQMLLEEAVAKSPAPTINVTKIDRGIAVQIQYTDQPTGQTVSLSFSVDR